MSTNSSYLVYFSFLIFSPLVWAEEFSVLPEIRVEDSASKIRSNQKVEDVSSVQKISKENIQSKNIQTFSDAIDNEKGIDAQTACAFCGTKRITINGLKGEHTTILIDGLPLHSAVSGFYGVDAIPLQGIESIDIHRGAGAALTLPESLGGAISIRTADPFIPLKEFRYLVSDDQQVTVSAVSTQKIASKTALLLGVQLGDSQPVDVDRNQVTEQPFLKTKSFLGKVKHKVNEVDELTFRLSAGLVNTIGGNPDPKKLTSPVPVLADSGDFVDRDVRKKWIGDRNKITDNINIERYELASSYSHQFRNDSTLQLHAAQAWQNQKSVYSHGYDYNNSDQLSYLATDWTKAVNDQHILVLGMDHKNEWMRSQSQELYLDQGLNKDNLTLQTYGGYLQDTWLLSDSTEISFVLRVDHLQTRWKDFNKSINQTVLAPRLNLKRAHDIWTSRFGYGIGYRSPLTLFESQHGTIHDGFTIDIDQVETSKSFVYSLSAQRMEDFFEFSTHFTLIENLAYGLDRADTGDSLLFKNASSQYLVSAYDLSYGRQINTIWSFEILAEFFDYPKGYKEKLPIAAQEKRLSFLSQLQIGKWHAEQKVTVVGEVDLKDYGYDRHYNIAFTDDDILSPTFGETIYQDQKKQKSPTYATLDLNFERPLSQLWQFGLGIKNVFDYTQTRAGDSPLTWAQHGSHFHLDNFHIWGPLRGRQIFLSLSGSLP